MTGRDRRHAPATILAQAGGWLEPPFGDLAPAIRPATTYERGTDGSYPHGVSYSRDTNPTYRQAEAVINRLEGGAGCRLYSSGMAAATSVFQALVPGDHVVVPQIMYWGLRGWLLNHARPRGLEVELVPPGDLDALRAAVRSGATRLVWIESPANPTWNITDIAAAAEIAHGAGAKLAVDSTVATPVLTRPLELGADLVMHSATKYLNGHSDVVAGALVTAADDEMWRTLGEIRHDGGAVLGPFEAWLLLRGLRTLDLRVRAACAGALRVAEAMRGRPGIAAVLYPGLADFPGHDVAARQMQGGFGGMLSLRVAGGEAGAMRLAARLELFKRATSLGGVESLVEHRASIEGPDSPVPDDLLRLSVGIEDPADLIADLDQALARL